LALSKVSPPTSNRPAAVVVAAALLVSGLAACTGAKDVPQRDAAQRFLDAVGSADATAAAAQTDNPGAAASALRASLAGLGPGARGSLKVNGLDITGNRATAHFVATWTLPGVSPKWRYTGSLPMAKNGDSWHVVWRDNDLHPYLHPGTHLVVRRVQPPRAALEDNSGQPLFAKTPVVRVGIQTRLVTNLPALAAKLAAVPELQSSAAEIIAACRNANPDDFVSLVTLRRVVYERIRPAIHDLNGTVFQTDTEWLAPSSHFGQPLLGTVDQASDEAIKTSEGRLQPGELTGLGGLQHAFNDELAGASGAAIYRAPAGGPGDGTLLTTLAVPRPGAPVRLSIDRAVQTAADAALASIEAPAAIVAVQRSTGRIVADANSKAATYDIGLSGAVPPGSTFKIVTYAAEFTANPHLTSSTIVPCPATTTVDGRRFENEDRFHHPPIPISAAFGYSCNTSAIDTAMALPIPALRDEATALGLGAKWTLPVQSFSGSLPLPATETERAADAIGQGRVQVSPLLMALLADAVSTGVPVTPTLIAGTNGTRGARLPDGLTAKMAELMKATVALPDGTAHALADLGDVRGKTGTAEYGNAKPPRSHSWFAGTRGDLAFAVFVYDGDSRHLDAVPIAHTFLAGLR
jgi:cell division protein FtsI/penicillin-binding protein 2